MWHSVHKMKHQQRLKTNLTEIQEEHGLKQESNFYLEGLSKTLLQNSVFYTELWKFYSLLKKQIKNAAPLK